jgi:hypothetical protein
VNAVSFKVIIITATATIAARTYLVFFVAPFQRRAMREIK